MTKNFVVAYSGMAQGHKIICPGGYHQRFIDDGKQAQVYLNFLEAVNRLGTQHGTWAELPDTPEVRQLIADMDAHEAAQNPQL